MIVDEIELDESNAEFNYAADFVKHTNRNIYLTGKAGTGKTTFLKYLRQTVKKNTAILAPTGIAAVGAGGQTIHSFFQIRPSVYVPDDFRLREHALEDDSDKSTIRDHFRYSSDRLTVIRSLELLIIDEISMVRCDLLDVIDKLLRIFRERRNEPFGGVQVIFIGDIFQLPPVADFEQWEILQSYYESPFFFSSKVISANLPEYIELKKIYRQKEQTFIDLLNRVRVNQVSNAELELINSRYDPVFQTPRGSNYIILATHTKIVDKINLAKLAEIPADLFQLEGQVAGVFPEKSMPTDRVLQLKIGAQIMFVKNDKPRGIFNGRIAIITAIEDNEIEVEFSDGSVRSIEKHEWNNVKYTWNEKERKIDEEVLGTFCQFPVRLAWAITVHKSQGLTFDRVIADLGAAFASGQVYVALSRCTSFQGLVLKSRIERESIIVDPLVLKFAKNETPDTLIVQKLNAGKADSLYRRARQLVRAGKFEDAFDFLKKAISFRNDIETPVFKRYVTLTMNKMLTFRSKYLEKLSEVEQLENTLKDMTDYQKKLFQEVEVYQSRIAELEQLVKSQQIEYNHIAQNASESQADSQNLLRRIKVLEDVAFKQVGTIEKANGTINHLKEVIVIKHHEIERLKKLKWYHKIIGKQ